MSFRKNLSRLKDNAKVRKIFHIHKYFVIFIYFVKSSLQIRSGNTIHM